MVKILPVILAAGGSARMGYPKALLPAGSDTFLTRILKTLGTIGLGRPHIVLGVHARLIRPLLEGWEAEIIVNPEPGRGMVSSLRLALESMDTAAAGSLVWPVDHPLVPAKLVRALVGLFVSSGAPLALPRCGDRAGHPAIFGRALIDEILAAAPRESPKPIVQRHRCETAWIDTEDRTTIDDIDTPEAYFRLFGETPETAWSRRFGRG